MKSNVYGNDNFITSECMKCGNIIRSTFPLVKCNCGKIYKSYSLEECICDCGTLLKFPKFILPTCICTLKKEWDKEKRT